MAVVRQLMLVQVLDWPCQDDYDYAIGLHGAKVLANKVVIVEHDIVPTVALVNELETCPGAFCAVDYECAGRGLWSTWADHSLLGLAKITARAWDRTPSRPAVPLVPWRDLAYVVSERIGPAHLHAGPVKHHHD